MLNFEKPQTNKKIDRKRNHSFSSENQQGVVWKKHLSLHKCWGKKKVFSSRRNSLMERQVIFFCWRKEKRRTRLRPRKDKVDIAWPTVLQSSSLNGPSSFFQKVLCEPGFCLFSPSLFLAATVQRQQQSLAGNILLAWVSTSSSEQEGFSELLS